MGNPLKVTLCSRVRCLWFEADPYVNTMRFNTIWFDWTAQRNDAPQVNETDFLLINGLSSTCKSNLGGIKITNFCGGHISKQTHKTSNYHIDQILLMQTFNIRCISIFPKLHPFTAALLIHSHLNCSCPSIGTKRLIFPSLLCSQSCYNARLA